MASFLSSFLRLVSGQIKSAPEAPTTPYHPNEFDELIANLISDLNSHGFTFGSKLSDFEAGKTIMELDNEQSRDLFLYCLPHHVKLLNESQRRWSEESSTSKAFSLILSAMAKRKLALTREHLLDVMSTLNASLIFYCNNFPISSIIRAIERFKLEAELDSQMRISLENLHKKILSSPYIDAEDRRLANKVFMLIHNESGIDISINPGEAWSDVAIEDIKAMDEQRVEYWRGLLEHCSKADASRPSKKWLTSASNLIGTIGEKQVVEHTHKWLRLIDKPRTTLLPETREWEIDRNLVFDDNNATVLKGLIWCLSLQTDDATASLLMRVGLHVYKKIPMHGAKSAKMGNAVVYALGNMAGRAGLSQLALLKIKTKYRQAIALIDKALVNAAQREGLTVDEIAEMGIPNYGLDTVGYGEETMGDHIAQIQVVGFSNVELRWQKSDGKVIKSIPAVVKSDYADELKDLKANIKDLKTMLSLQRQRIEQLFLRERQWAYDEWLERYVEHPVVGLFTRTLIWRIEQRDSVTLSMWRGGQLEGIDGKMVEVVPSETTVTLWHPIMSGVDEIKAWRKKLIDREITQPFKQAHREVYILTDAERTTSTYSNRFASHVIKQHQFNALRQMRGWDYTLQGAWDGGTDNVASLALDVFNLQAEFWVHAVGEYGEDTSDAGIFMFCSSDQVRFYQLKRDVESLNANNILDESTVALEDIPAIVLSEVFRDVDLYVGVCSVGNDPEWSDGGPDGRYRDYWHSVSFGELNASAETRKEILQGLIPKLHFADRCRFVDRFLVVEGRRRIYKIHLGSGNILMEPNNQYLCIVPDSRQKSKEQKVFLPFEGDNMLSLILSKAVLLANDDKITDSTINSQIGNP